MKELTSSRGWREDIIQKYSRCNNIQPEEFKSYLKIVRASIIADNKFINKIYSHIISSLVTFLITQLVTNTVGKSDSALLVQFIVWAVYIICFVFILIPVVFILIDYFRNIRNSDFKLFFVDSYIEVIEDMCCIQQERDIK